MLSYESINRLFHPRPVEGGTVAIVAGIGIVINLASAFLFFKNKEHDLNTKGAYLHLLTDALVSVGVVISGLIIRFTSWYWLDGAVSIVILIVILIGTWSLLTASLRMSMDAVPENVETDAIEKVIRGVAGVQSVHHMHIWSMSTTGYPAGMKKRAALSWTRFRDWGWRNSRSGANSIDGSGPQAARTEILRERI